MKAQATTNPSEESKMNRTKKKILFICGCFLQLPLFIPNLISFYFFVVIICLGGSEFGVERESFGFPFFGIRGSFGSPQKG